MEFTKPNINQSLVISHWSLVIWKSDLLLIPNEKERMTKDEGRKTKDKKVGWVETFLLLSLSKYGTSLREAQQQ
ncbi:UNVERIFIED_CONTAM: hypothetical protein BEN50_05820 [Euhalothece sp. KZN 001]